LSSKDDATAISILKKSQSSLTAANYFGTDNFIIVRFRTPKIYDDADNTTLEDPYTEVETYSGVYKVVLVTSRFELGKFTQDLDCILDPDINISKFVKDLESTTNSTPAKTATTNDTVQSNSLPIKTTRLNYDDITIKSSPDILGNSSYLLNTPTSVEKVLSNIPTMSLDKIRKL
jgi:hypothetical protein